MRTSVGLSLLFLWDTDITRITGEFFLVTMFLNLCVGVKFFLIYFLFAFLEPTQNEHSEAYHIVPCYNAVFPL